MRFVELKEGEKFYIHEELYVKIKVLYKLYVRKVKDDYKAELMEVNAVCIDGKTPGFCVDVDENVIVLPYDVFK